MNNKKSFNLISLILMIFTSVFGFANIPRSFYLMGYGAIPWFIFGALAFFIPYSFMMAEFGTAFKNEKGGIYLWMEKSVGARYAFIGIFMWYASYVIWMVNVSSTIWIPLSNLIFGYDSTSEWSFWGISPTKIIGILGCIWVFLVYYISKSGIEKISKITNIGGIAVSGLNVVLLIGALAVLFFNGFNLSQPASSLTSFINSPNPAYQSVSSMLSFLVFAIFAFGGIEVVSGLVDQIRDPEKEFPLGLTISAIVISVGYSLGIFLIGIFTNWSDILSAPEINMANVAYIVMSNLGFSIGEAFGLNLNTCVLLGSIFARFVGFSMFLALSGAFFTLSYSPLKQLIDGTPSEIWPKKFLEGKNENGVPSGALMIQTVVVAIIILIISFGGKSAGMIFTLLVLMTNVAMTIPYAFISIAYIFFKKNESIKKPFVIIKNRSFAIFLGAVVTITVTFANIFTIIEPSLKGDYVGTIAMIAGPIIFSIVAIYLYSKKV